jgi:hypothetical protein
MLRVLSFNSCFVFKSETDCPKISCLKMTVSSRKDLWHKTTCCPVQRPVGIKINNYIIYWIVSRMVSTKLLHTKYVCMFIILLPKDRFLRPPYCYFTLNKKSFNNWFFKDLSLWNAYGPELCDAVVIHKSGVRSKLEVRRWHSVQWQEAS